MLIKLQELLELQVLVILDVLLLLEAAEEVQQKSLQSLRKLILQKKLML
jgi:hypothetical protein